MKRKVNSERISDNIIRLTTSSGYQIRLYANHDVPIDHKSVESVNGIGDIHADISRLRQTDFFGGSDTVDMFDCILTPDFHKGAGIPVGTVMETSGFVIPRSAGRDIGCGMRIVVLDIEANEIRTVLTALQTELRKIFFQGGRDLPLDEAGREAMLREGLPGLLGVSRLGGFWNSLPDSRISREIEHACQNGSWKTENSWMFDDYIRGSGGVSRDAAIGSIGGGNHFVEIQEIDEILDKKIGYDMHIHRGKTAVMIHSGSLGLGGMVGDHFVDRARNFVRKFAAASDEAFHPLPLIGPYQEEGRSYLSAMGLAANFAIVNRLAMTVMVEIALQKVLGREVISRTIYDAPHNLVWWNGDVCVHRKGASPAEAEMPVVLPGSMGDASWLLIGKGNQDTIFSAPHGSGRMVNRGSGRSKNPEEVEKLQVVTPIDWKTLNRADIKAEKLKELMEEAPSNYKPSLPALNTVTESGMASVVAKMSPIMTVKG